MSYGLRFRDPRFSKPVSLVSTTRSHPFHIPSSESCATPTGHRWSIVRESAGISHHSITVWHKLENYCERINNNNGLMENTSIIC